MPARMNIDVFWEHIFSDDRAQVLEAWRGLSADERESVFDLLSRIIEDPDRIAAQRQAARFAIATIRSATPLPEGALAFTKQLARETAQILKIRSGSTASTLKGDGSLVTESDMESDRRISAAIRARYPDHAILSEERQKRYTGSEWAWLIDPIDGTTNFAWGFPCWGVLIALLHFGDPVLAVADFPSLDEHYHAVRDGGVFLNDVETRAMPIPVNVAGDPELQPTQLFVTCTRTLEAGQLNVSTKIRVSGSTGYDLALVASGVVVGASERRVFAWDIAPGWLFIKESKGAAMQIDPDNAFFPLRNGLDCAEVKLSVLAAATPNLLAHFAKALKQ